MSSMLSKPGVLSAETIVNVVVVRIPRDAMFGGDGIAGIMYGFDYGYRIL